ncbi:MAG: hypothetical protein AAGK97_08230, partial [Bacteroidota bacterium]
MKIVLRLMKPTLCLFFGMLMTVAAFAQPANDDCANAIALVVGDDKGSALGVMGDTREGTAATAPDSVCSGSWFMDDVFFTVDVVSVTNGVTIDVDFGDMENDVIGVGMAVYSSCDAGAIPIKCFSSDQIINDNVYLAQCDLSNVSDLIVRVWSGGSPNDNSGTFRISAYKGTPDRWIWHESFGNGIGDWNAYGWCDGESTQNPFNPNYTWEYVPDGRVFVNGPDANPFTVNTSAETFCDGSAVFNVRNHPNGCSTANGARANGFFESPWISTVGWEDGVALNIDQSFAESFGFFNIQFRLTNSDEAWQFVENDHNYGALGFRVIENTFREAIFGLSTTDSLQVRL